MTTNDAECIRAWLAPMRRNSRPKSQMEYAVEHAWDAATSTVGDPEDGVEMHDLAALADGIVAYLLREVAA